jgi:hypothetical protein
MIVQSVFAFMPLAIANEANVCLQSCNVTTGRLALSHTSRARLAA